jgi:hypothetical protein
MFLKRIFSYLAGDCRLQWNEEVLPLVWGIPMPLPVRSSRYDDNFWHELYGAPAQHTEAQNLKDLISLSMCPASAKCRTQTFR